MPDRCKCLGIIIDDSLSFIACIQQVVKKVKSIWFQLSNREGRKSCFHFHVSAGLWCSYLYATVFTVVPYAGYFLSRSTEVLLETLKLFPTTLCCTHLSFHRLTQCTLGGFRLILHCSYLTYSHSLSVESYCYWSQNSFLLSVLKVYCEFGKNERSDL